MDPSYAGPGDALRNIMRPGPADQNESRGFFTAPRAVSAALQRPDVLVFQTEPLPSRPR